MTLPPISGIIAIAFSRAARVLAVLGIATHFLAAQSYAATTLEELLAKDELRAAVIVDTQGPLYQRAPFILAVEVATARWFGRGTRVSEIRLPGAVVRPLSSFADNNSRKINGETWSVQRWRFRVYPREPGTLALPPVTVSVSVNAQNHGVVEGVLTLDAITAQIVAVPGIEGVDPGAAQQWIAAPSLRIEQRWEGRHDNYMTGDAITRTRQFVAQDTPAMMLDGGGMPAIDGLSLYQAPAELSDQSDRGTLIGTRTETLVVTFESPGQYRLPGLDYLWFNTTTGAFETLSLPAMDLVVTAGAAAPSRQAQANMGKPRAPLLITSALGLLLAMLLWLGWDTKIPKQLRAWLSIRRQERRRRKQYQHAMHKKDSARCLQLLRDQMTRTGSHTQLSHAVRAYSLYAGPSNRLSHGARSHAAANDALQGSLRQLLEHAYGNGTEMPGSDDAMQLWRAVSHAPAHRSRPSALALNPPASSP